jgi:hypothetical protein
MIFPTKICVIGFEVAGPSCRAETGLTSRPPRSIERDMAMTSDTEATRVAALASCDHLASNNPDAMRALFSPDST